MNLRNKQNVKCLKDLQTNNDGIVVKNEKNKTIIEKIWEDASLRLEYDNNEDLQFFSDLQFPKELAAILHIHSNLFEFIFTCISEEDQIKNRRFEFNFQNKKYVAYFDKPSKNFVKLVKGFKPSGERSETYYRNLELLHDYYNQDPNDNLMIKYFKDKTPINFFIKGEFSENMIDNIKIFEHLNIFMSYFDRETPQILIYKKNQKDDKEKYNIPCFSKLNHFPSNLNISFIDPIILDLLNEAMETKSIRLRYIFYYQILEYYSYYFLDNTIKRKINNIIRNPDLIDNISKYSNFIIEELKDVTKQNKDSARLNILIKEFCNFEDIKMEINSNIDHFIQDIEFDGGLIIKKLLKSKEEINSPSNSIMDEIIARIEKIRNVLVHLREMRENKVIHPTDKNNRLLLPNLYLIRRIAEIVSIKYC